MLPYSKLAENARCFKTLTGMSTQEFDLLFAKVEKARPEAERERLSKRPRKRAIGAGRRFGLDLRNRVLLGADPARMRPIESECLWAQEVAERT